MSAPPPEGTASLSELRRRLGPRAVPGHPLGALTTYRVGGPAALYVEAGDEEDLVAVARALTGLEVPVLALGRGSNMLVADAGFSGLVVHPTGELAGMEVLAPEATGPVVRAGGALSLPALARRSVDAGLTGLEWAVGVPGSVGGALRMNAGGHGSDVAASLRRYRVVDLTAGAAGERAATDHPAEHLALGYRSSQLRASEVVVSAELSAGPGERAAGKATIAEIVRWRREHQPGGSNAGSVFVNPPDDSAGRLVEAAGLKGWRCGSARVSEKHANFIQADEGGSATDVRRLMEHVRDEVARRFGLRLRSEVRLVGFAGQGGEEASAR